MFDCGTLQILLCLATCKAASHRWWLKVKPDVLETSLFLSSGRWILFLDDKNGDGSWNVGFFTFHPPDVAGIAREFHCIQLLWKLQNISFAVCEWTSEDRKKEYITVTGNVKLLS